jgi:repressor LexA
VKAALSEKQQLVLDFLKEQILTNGYPPSVREICESVRLSSTSTIHSHLRALQRKGYIRRDPAKNRAIEILDEGFSATGREMAAVPVVARAIPGAAIFERDNIVDTFPIPLDYIKNAPCFMLRAPADFGAILQGDMVLAQQQSEIKLGEMVIFITNGNTYIQTLSHATAQSDIIGKVIGLYRRY